ncbi:hypothetical protein BaRGS_00024266 [Batillaria attramentaria]|uniref:GPI ethanolamine phosphate transferase 3, catalytic subunit n=1 Tax=Batillaria attramentaria TaxID=370345 RepID=A0ABD0KBP6_9CAEN
MRVGTRTGLLLLFLASTYIAGLLIFTRGFLLVRTAIHKNSSCEVDFAAKEDHSYNGYSGCWMHSRFKRAVIIIIDALKHDFMAYNSSLGDNAPPYKNKLVTIHALLNRRPQNAKLYKFLADPPTTTLQRLKGLTTGSLPTFVDAGSNFDSTEISEDNLIDQLIGQGKDIKFLGDDTWESLFPNRFSKALPFPSFNVKDLHTVDNGILNHLYSEVRRRDWDVIIAHFLGVDHCGHRYGPDHPAMAEKLSQMDQVIRNVTQLLKDDTVLFVFGDHGMTRTGDHGGDSKDELTAGLFVYSPAQITSSPPHQDNDQIVQQTDLVPTVALLMGVPIPFSNLGSVILDLFNHCPWWDTQSNTVRQVFHTVEALHLNALQVSHYISAYAAVSSDFPSDKFHKLNNMLERAETELQGLVTSASSGTGTQGLEDRLRHLQHQYQTYLSEVRHMCQDVWAKFDLVSITLGALTVFVSLLLNVVFIVCWSGEEEELPGFLPFVVGGLILHVIYYAIHILIFPPTVPPVMAFMLGLVLTVTLVVVLKRKFLELIKDTMWRDGVDPLSAFAEGASGYRNRRYFFTVFCLLLALWLVRRWMQYYGSLNGEGVNVLCMKYIPPVGGVACALFWAVQALPQKQLDALPVWQQTIMAQVVYVCAILHLIVVALQPLFVYVWRTPSASSFSVPSPNAGAETAIPYVFKQLQQQWHKKDDSESDSPPAVYGLGSVYSCSVVAFVSSLFLVLVLLLGDGVSPSLTLALTVLFIFMELMSAYCHGRGSSHEPVPWIGVVTYGLLSSTFFYATGHQPTIPSIRFESAFTGFHGDFSTNVLPGLLIGLNTFAAPVFFTAVAPVLLFWPYLEGPVSRWMVVKQKEASGQWRGDFRLFDNGVLLRKNLFNSFCRLLLFHAVKVFGAACAAGLHRRHLMVWKIFAPRFIFEAVTMIIVSAVSVLMLLFILHVDRAVFKLTRSLELKS